MGHQAQLETGEVHLSSICLELGKRERKKEGAKAREKKIVQGMLIKEMEAKLIHELTGLSCEELDRLKTEL